MFAFPVQETFLYRKSVTESPVPLCQCQKFSHSVGVKCAGVNNTVIHGLGNPGPRPSPQYLAPATPPRRPLAITPPLYIIFWSLDRNRTGPLCRPKPQALCICCFSMEWYFVWSYNPVILFFSFPVFHRSYSKQWTANSILTTGATGRLRIPKKSWRSIVIIVLFVATLRRPVRQTYLQRRNDALKLIKIISPWYLWRIPRRMGEFINVFYAAEYYNSISFVVAFVVKTTYCVLAICLRQWLLSKQTAPDMTARILTRPSKL